MGTPASPWDLAQSITAQLAVAWGDTSIGTGVYTEKVDPVPTPASETPTNVVSAWGNLIDDYVRTSFVALSRKARIWQVATLATLGSDDGLLVGDLGRVLASPDVIYRCSATAPTSSTWAVMLDVAALTATIAAAQATADAAQADATDALADAAAAQATATSAASAAATAQATATSAAGAAATAQATATSAQADATDALADAAAAQADATAALAAAAAAQADATDALADAATAQATATTAQATATGAASDAAAAAAVAATALSDAADAQSDATTALGLASTALANAATAQTTADTAQSELDAYQVVAGQYGTARGNSFLTFLTSRYTALGPIVNALATGTIALTSNGLRVWPYVAPQTFTIDNLTFRVTTAVASSLVRGVTYDVDPATGKPVNLLRAGSDASCAATGNAVSSFSSLQIVQGERYWVGCHASLAPTMRGMAIGALSGLGMFLDAAATAQFNSLLQTVTFASGAPATWTWADSQLTTAAIMPIAFCQPVSVP